jgi:hypothetical protein
VVDPGTFELHRSILDEVFPQEPGQETAHPAFPEKAVLGGPETLGPAEKKDLLYDPETLGLLHRRVWELTDPDALGRWGLL